MRILEATDPAFREYGRVVGEIDGSELRAELRNTPLPTDGTVYVASDPALEKLPVFDRLQQEGFGELPIQIGYCNGVNHRLDALEYHRSSEINLPADDLILLLGRVADVDPVTHTYDTGRVRAFRVSAGCMVEIYATSLHYAPCSVGDGGFRNAVILPRGTNGPLSFAPPRRGEARLLFAANKWLIAHPESGLGKQGAFVGLTGENITLK